MKKKILSLLIVGVFSCSLMGCMDSFKTKANKHGGYFVSSTGNYEVINYSGNRIMDVWLLKDTYVAENSNSDGCVFTDNDGNSIDLQGDVKIIRIKDLSELNDYKEYHAEKDLISYEEFMK